MGSLPLETVVVMTILGVVMLCLLAQPFIMNARRRPDRNDTLALSHSERMLTDAPLSEVTELVGYDAKVSLIQDVSGLTSKVVDMFARVEVQVPELDGVVLERDGQVGIEQLRCSAGEVVGRPQRTSRAADDDQVADPLRVVRRQHEPGHRMKIRRKNGGSLTSDRVHHRDCVFGPTLRPQHVQVRRPRRKPHSAQIKSDHPGEGRQAPMEAVQGGFVVDRVNGDERPRQHQQIQGTITKHLVGDIQIAAPGVPGTRSLRHRHRLIHDCNEPGGFGRWRRNAAYQNGVLRRNSTGSQRSLRFLLHHDAR